MPRCDTPTLLSLSHFAKILGLDPLHFSQGISRLRPNPQCSAVWYQYDWQDPDKVSRDQIGILIAQCERDLADALGYYPAPVYIEDERHQYPHPMRPESVGGGGNLQLRWKSLRLNRGYVIEGGVRATTYIGDFCWVAVDADGDGFPELAKFTIVSDIDPRYDICRIKAYFKEYDESDARNSRTDPTSEGADPRWEVRPLRIVREDDETLIVYTYVWELFKPQLQEELAPQLIDADDFGDGPPEDPCDYLSALDLGSYVDVLSFYLEYTDNSQQVTFMWNTDRPCTDPSACSTDVQTGCLWVKDRRASLVTPRPAVYNEDVGQFNVTGFSNCVEPDWLSINYLAGWTPEKAWGQFCQSLDNYWARIITMMVVARMDWPLCDCTNVVELTNYWRRDTAMMESVAGGTSRSFYVNTNEQTNPFGTRVGEILAWRMVVNAQGRRLGKAVMV